MGNVILNPKTVDPLRLLQCYPQASGQRGVVLQVTFYQSPGACEAISRCCNVNKASYVNDVLCFLWGWIPGDCIRGQASPDRTIGLPEGDSPLLWSVQQE